MKKILALTFLFLGFAYIADSQVLDRDRSKYAQNNFAEDDKYTMLEPYETVSVVEPKGKKVKNIIFMIGQRARIFIDGLGGFGHKLALHPDQ